MAQSLTNFAAMLKQVYRQMVLNLMNNEIALYNRFKRAPSEVWEGRDVIKWPLITGRSQAFGSGRPGGPLPDPQHTPTADMEVPLRFIWGSIGIDAPTMKIARSDKGSFARALDFEMDRFKEAYFDYLNEICWADGRGILALVNVAGTSTTTLTVDSPMGVAGSINGARFLQPSMRVAILAADGSSITAVRRVESIAADGNSVTLNSAVTAGQAPDNGLVVRCPSLLTTDVADVSYLTDPMGLIGMLDDGTYVNDYFGFNRTTQPLARTSVFPNVGALNMDVIQQMRDVIEQVGRGRPSESWMHHSTRRAYLALTVANRQFISTGGAADNDAGFKGNALDGKNPEFGGVPCMVDKDAPYRIWFDVDWKEAVKFPNTEFEWASESGAILKQVPGVDAFTAYARMFYNLCHGKPLACGRMDDINTNIVVAHVR